jgi:hypothetical protein
VSRARLAPARQPLSAMANYVFDGIERDVFRVARGQRVEGARR